MTLKHEQMKVHRCGPRKYLCNDCGRKFALMASLTRHRFYECSRESVMVERNSQESPINERKKKKKKHVCPDCNRVYAVFTSLWRHQKYECIGIEPKFICPIWFWRRNAYVNSKAEMPATCPRCGRTYKMKRNLNTHMKFECGGQKNFTCHVCPAKFTQNISLRRHLLQRHNVYLPPKFSIPKRILPNFQ